MRIDIQSAEILPINNTGGVAWAPPAVSVSVPNFLYSRRVYAFLAADQGPGQLFIQAAVNGTRQGQTVFSLPLFAGEQQSGATLNFTTMNLLLGGGTDFTDSIIVYPPVFPTSITLQFGTVALQPMKLSADVDTVSLAISPFISSNYVRAFLVVISQDVQGGQ